MIGRTRSPSYPSTSLEEAVELIKKLHDVERSNPIDREVAAKALGYSGISGRSSTILSNLSQYGLLERAGKNEVRVTRRAVEILYPDTDASKATALREAASEPELFQRVMSRFIDGHPSDNALEAFLVKQDFTHTAIPAAIKAFKETFSYLENVTENESNGSKDIDRVESHENQELNERHKMRSSTTTELSRKSGEVSIATLDQYYFDPAKKKIRLGAWISSKEEANEAISYIQALKEFLPTKEMLEPEIKSSTNDENDKE